MCRCAHGYRARNYADRMENKNGIHTEHVNVNNDNDVEKISES